MIPSFTTVILFLSVASEHVTSLSNFQVLRGDNQPKLGDLKVSNTPYLRQFAALTGERVVVELLNDTQTAIVQDSVNVLMDCSSLIEASGSQVEDVKWTRLSYFEDDFGNLYPKGSVITIYSDPVPARFRAEGEQRQLLNITRTNIANGPERTDNGLYTCTVYTAMGNYSSSVMLFMIGAPPRLDFGADNAAAENSTSSYTAKHYRVGTDFCVEQHGSLGDLLLELSCNVLGENLTEHASIAFPLPSRKWYKDDILLYSVDPISKEVCKGINPSFFWGKNALLDQGVVSPSPLLPLQDGGLVLFFSSASNLTSSSFPQGTTNATLAGDVFNVLLGKWSCEVENILGKQAAETVITEC